MTIEQLRRLKHLSEMPTHSAESLGELKELVRMATIRVMVFDGLTGTDFLCENCANKQNCHEDHAHFQHCEAHNGFQLRMGDD